MTFQGNIDALPGREVFGSDGRKIGKVGQVYVLEGTDDPTWMTVHTGLFGSHESFVPVSEATERGDEVHVPFEKAFVHDAPRIDDASELTVEHEAELYRYYGVQPPLVHGADAGAQADEDRRRSEDDRGSHDEHAANDDASSTDERPAATPAFDERPDRSEGTSATVSTGAPRLRRRIVTEMQTIQVPVQREEIIVEGDGLDDGSQAEEQGRSPR